MLLQHVRAPKQQGGALGRCPPAPVFLERVVGRFDRSVDFLGAAALDDGDHLAGGGILDWKAVGFGARRPAEGSEFGCCLVGCGGHCYSLEPEGVPTVGHDRLAGDPGGLVCGEQEDAPGNVGGFGLAVDHLAAQAGIHDRLREPLGHRRPGQ